MSISFNHPKDTMTSTSTLELIVPGGTPTLPRPIRLSASSIIMPVRALPAGEMGAMVFDTASKTMKYHNGTSWISIESADTILQPVNVSLADIYNKLDTKVDTVTYTSSAVPSATISGTNMSIVFPYTPLAVDGPTGLYTALKPGCIVQYALTSGQTAPMIREQISGIVNGQGTRDGTENNPYLTADGWCLADGMWWSWTSETGITKKQVPNLCKEAYLRGMDINGQTQITSVIGSVGATDSTVLTVNQIPPMQFTVSGTTSSDGLHSHSFKNIYSTRISIDDVHVDVFRSGYGGGGSTNSAGLHTHTFTGTSNVIGGGQGHVHTLSNLDVNHFNVAYLYNIAESNVALSESVANTRYVLKAGDVMTGSLTIANGATIKGADNSLVLYFRSDSDAERAAIIHNGVNNTLRLRSNGGNEVTINQSGDVVIPGTSTVGGNSTVGGKNVVRSVNSTNADANGNVDIPFTGIEDIRQSGIMYLWVGKDAGTRIAGAGACVVGAQVNGEWDNNEQLVYTWLQKLINGVWITIGRV